MKYSEEQLHEVVQHQLLAAITEGRARNPVKLGDYIRKDLIDAEKIYPGTIAAAYHSLHPDPEYVDPGLYVYQEMPNHDPEIGRKAIAEFRERMGWQRPAKTDRLEAEHSDVRGFTRPKLELVMSPDLEPCHACGAIDVLDDEGACSSCGEKAEPEPVAVADPDDDLDDHDLWNQEPA